jgi:hypothetical protein
MREAEVRLSEHSKLRRALELDEVPDHTSLCKFVARLEEAVIARALDLIPAKYPRYEGRAAIVAINATGLSTHAVLGTPPRPSAGLEALVGLAGRGRCVSWHAAGPDRPTRTNE